MSMPTGAPMPELKNRYRIVESEIGPLISESRCTVFDVMEMQNAGESLYAISALLNLTPLQAQTALDYIVQHRAALEPQLAVILQQRAERERHYRAIADEIQLQIAAEPMTRQRAEFLTLRERNAAAYQASVDAGRIE